MSMKKVLVSVHHPLPVLGVAEVLGPALGLATGYKPKQVTVMFHGHSVVTALASQGKRYLAAAEALGVEIQLEEAGLESVGAKAEDFSAKAISFTAEDFVKLWKESDLHLRL